MGRTSHGVGGNLNILREGVTRIYLYHTFFRTFLIILLEGFGKGGGGREKRYMASKSLRVMVVGHD